MISEHAHIRKGKDDQILDIMGGGKERVDNSTLCLDDEYIGVNTVKNRLIVERNLIQLV